MIKNNITAEAPQKEESSLMKIVQAIAISPENARCMVKQYSDQIRINKPNLSEAQVKEILCKKIITRYSKLAATTGGATALAGVIPGIGTVVSMVGGSMADISACIKFQVDMTMCLALTLNDKLEDEDAKHMSYIIALFGTIEQATSQGATKLASKAGVRMINQYLKGPTLVTIKELFKKVGIQFTQKAATKVIPFGVGVIIGASANYALTKYVGKNALEFLQIHNDEASHPEAA